MSAQPGARAIPSKPNLVQANVALRRNVLQCVQMSLRRSSLPLWFRLKHPPRPNCSRADIFNRSADKCVYCGTTLLDGVNATVDHLLPRCLSLCDAIANQAGNRLACCRECNALKRDWFLPPSHRSWRSRDAYLATARRVVTGQRIIQNRCEPSRAQTVTPADL